MIGVFYHLKEGKAGAGVQLAGPDPAGGEERRAEPADSGASGGREDSPARCGCGEPGLGFLFSAHYEP